MHPALSLTLPTSHDAVPEAPQKVPCNCNHAAPRCSPGSALIDVRIDLLCTHDFICKLSCSPDAFDRLSRVRHT
jgi:hypothetical protein